MAWLQDRSTASEEGREKWKEFVEWVFSPPPVPGKQQAPTLTPGMRAAGLTVVPPSQHAAAFDARLQHVPGR